MTDRYARLTARGPGRALVRRLGLPAPRPLRRYHPGDPILSGPAMVGGSGRWRASLEDLVDRLDVARLVPDSAEASAAAAPAALIFDASDLAAASDLRALYNFGHPYVRALSPGGRVIVVGTPPADGVTVAQATAQRAVEGFVRSVGKEMGRGSTANLVYASPGADLESTLRFLLSGKSAYVSGQVIRVGAGSAEVVADLTRPLAGKVALVTGAARNIGAAIAHILARDGAMVICLDIPAAGDALSTVANDVAGQALLVDITAGSAPERIAREVADRHGRVDILVHNAGITRDKTLARMRPEQWDSVLSVNLLSQEHITTALLANDLIPPGGRVIGLSSVTGIAGNRGQTNYATSKAGVIGLVQAWAPALAERTITINAVAPGFIETSMTAAMPLMLREAARRMTSMAQGGLPVDVAETIAYLAHPGSGGITGNVIRVCGQALIGA